jgi:hypothetical protein
MLMSETETKLACTGFLCLLLISLLPAPLNAARGGSSGDGGKTEVLPMTKAAPSAVVIDTAGSEAELRRQLRQKNAVTELSGASKVPFSQAPTGSFGFIAPQFLGMALVTQSPDMILERAAPVPNAYEVHKLADGSGMLVGFVGRDLLAPLIPANRPKNIRISLFSNPSGSAPHIAAIPMIKLMVDRMPVRVDAKKQDSAVVLDMDLQGTANRKSVPGSQ